MYERSYTELREWIVAIMSSSGLLVLGEKPAKKRKARSLATDTRL